MDSRARKFKLTYTWTEGGEPQRETIVLTALSEENARERGNSRLWMYSAYEDVRVQEIIPL